MATSDDRLTTSSINNSALGSPLGLILNQLIIMTYHLQSISGLTDSDVSLMQVPSPNWATGVTQLTTAIN